MSEGLNCPSCTKSFTQTNPPRLLPMCGHTFCHRCIKALIVLRKSTKGGQYRITCPLDKAKLYLQSNSANFFPKNMALVDLAIKRTRISIEGSKNQFLSMEGETTTRSLDSHRSNSSQKDKVIEKSVISGDENETDSRLEERCEEHDKVLDIVCLIDRQKICAECALFGAHKGHNFSSIKQLQNQKNELYSKLLDTMQRKHIIQNKISNKELQNQILSLLEKQRDYVLEEAKQHYKKLISEIKSAEKQFEVNLHDRFQETKLLIQKSTSLDNSLIEPYNRWEERALQMLKTLENKNFMNYLDLLVKKTQLTETLDSGENLVTKMKERETKLFEEVGEIVQQLKIEVNPTILKFVNGYVTIPDSCSKPVTMQQVTTADRLNISIYQCEDLNDVSLLSSACVTDRCEFYPRSSNVDEGSILLKDSNQSVLVVNNVSMKQRENISPQRIDMKKRTKVSKLQINPRLITSKVENKFRTGRSSSSLLRSTDYPKDSKDGMVMQFKLPKRQYQNMKDPQKYQRTINAMQKDLLVIVDFNNAELGDQMVTDLLQKIKKSKCIRTVRLVRNNITDSCINVLIDCLQRIDTLVLAQNYLSNDFVDILMEHAKKMKFENVKNIMIGQNTMNLRKLKEKAEELKKWNINLVL